MRIIGIDPGKTLGWAVYDGEADRVMASGEVVYPAREGCVRVEQIKDDWGRRFLDLRLRFGCRWVAIERMVSMQNGADRNLHAVAEAIRYAAKVNSVQSFQIAIPTWKKDFTGRGNANEEAIQVAAAMVAGLGPKVGMFRQNEACAIGVAVAAYPKICEKEGIVVHGRIHSGPGPGGGEPAKGVRGPRAGKGAAKRSG